MKILEEQFEHTGFNFQQITRKNNYAIYRKTKEGVRNYEVVVIKSHDGKDIMGRYYEPSEIYPASSNWGHDGWTYISLESAVDKFNELSGENIDFQQIETKLDRNNIITQKTSVKKEKKPRAKSNSIQIELPDGEFRIKGLAEKYNTYPAQIHNILKSKFQGKYKVIRREKSNNGRGKPSNILSKI